MTTSKKTITTATKAITSGPALYLFAHQDDELSIAPQIASDLAAGGRAVCVFLTNGLLSSPAHTRDRESLQFLTSLGVRASDIFFCGTSAGIKDSELPQNIQRALDEVLKQTAHLSSPSPSPFSKIISMAWEGGHPDHDAAHLIALALAKKWNLLSHTWQYYLYHGAKTPGRFFRVMNPLYLEKTSLSVRWTVVAGLHWLRSSLKFRTQYKTLIGFFPQLFFIFLFRRKLYLNPIHLARSGQRPHSGPLLYERWNRMSFAEFCSHTQNFCLEQLGTSLLHDRERIDPAVQEIRYLHAKIFHCAPSYSMEQQYLHTSAQFLEKNNSSLMVKMDRMVAHNLDLQSIEYVLRHRPNLLTQKIHTLLYLAEVKSAYYSEFMNEHSARIKAWATLAFLLFKSFYQRIKGRYLIWRYQLV